MGVFLVLLASVASAECTLPRTASELEGLVGEAEGAWGNSVEAFGESLGAIAPVLACVNTPLNPSLTARILRLSGLRSFVDRDTVTAAATFAAARVRNPALDLPSSWAPEGNALRAVWDTAHTAEPSLAIRKARRGQLYVDGEPALFVPTDRPFVLQWIDGVRVSAGLATDDNLPSYPRSSHPARDPLLLASAAAALAAGTLYGLAWSANADFAAATDRTALDDATLRANDFTVAAGCAGGVSVLALGAGVAVAAVK